MNVEIECKGHKYSLGKLPAMQEFHVLRRLSGLLTGLLGMVDLGTPAKEVLADKKTPNEDKIKTLVESLGTKDLGGMLEPLTRELSSMDDADAEYIIQTCLSVVKREQSPGQWASVMANGQFMFEDMDMVVMLTLTAKVVMGNMQSFFPVRPVDTPGETPT